MPHAEPLNERSVSAHFTRYDFVHAFARIARANTSSVSATIRPRNMPVEAEVLAARLTRIKTLLDAIEPVCLESEGAHAIRSRS
jgi:hypothetical protein